MSNYQIKGETLTGIADAIRSKTGGTDPILVADMAAQIEGITGGGGASSDVRYVTFMSHDGAVELGKKAVAVGDDCADPIARGVFETPTKDSTAQYDFSFVGWAASANGAWDESALKAVTEDKTVYAAYASVLRYYTITYYDEDGATVLTTKSVSYGSVPYYTPTKSGYVFGGWTPALTTVTGEASYIASWKTVYASGAINDYTAWSLSTDGVLTISGNGSMGDFHYSDPLPPWNSHKDRIKSVIIEDGVTNVGGYAFYKYANITSATISDSVLVIGACSFDSTGIESIVIPNGVTEIKTGAFRGLGITSIDIPNSVVSIGGAAFANSNTLKNAIIGSGATSIKDYCFSGCSALESVTFADTDTWYVGASEGAITTQVDVTDPATNATYMKNTYKGKYWTKV